MKTSFLRLPYNLHSFIIGAKQPESYKRNRLFSALNRAAVAIVTLKM